MPKKTGFFSNTYKVVQAGYVCGIGVFVFFGRHAHDAVFLNFGRIDLGYREIAKKGQ